MPTLVLDPPPPELQQEFNLGDSDRDFRVPDGGLHRPNAAEIWHPTAALVVEIVSPGDETWDKLPFYAKHHVDKVLIVDPEKRSVDWLALAGAEYRPVEHSGLIELEPAELAERIDWPWRSRVRHTGVAWGASTNTKQLPRQTSGQACGDAAESRSAAAALQVAVAAATSVT